MKKTVSRILAGVIAAASAASLAACSDGENTATTVSTTERTEWTGDKVDVTVAEDNVDNTLDTQGKVLRWMGFYDLNPTNDNPERSVEVALFEDVYGAKIEWMETSHSNQFNDLSNAIVGGTPPDIVVFDVRNFPNDVNKGQFQSVDSIIDWNDPMWAEMKTTADQFIWEGEHYVAPFGYGFNDYQLLMYNKDLVAELGMDDPYELFEKGEWDWDNFLRLMKEFKDSADERYGINGWWANALVATSGDVFVTYDGNKFTNNLYSQPIERAQNVISEIWNSGLAKRGWWDPAAVFTDDDVLFYGMGTWAYEGAASSLEGKRLQVLPFPKDPNADGYYMNKSILSHMWIKQSENADVVKAWFNVNRLALYDPQYYDTAKEKFLSNNPHWPSDIYDLVYSYKDDTKFAFNFEYAYGMSEEFCGDNGYVKYLQEGIVNEKFETWTQGREEHMNIFDTAVDSYNNR